MICVPPGIYCCGRLPRCVSHRELSPPARYLWPIFTIGCLSLNRTGLVFRPATRRAVLVACAVVQRVIRRQVEMAVGAEHRRWHRSRTARFVTSSTTRGAISTAPDCERISDHGPPSHRRCADAYEVALKLRLKAPRRRHSVRAMRAGASRPVTNVAHILTAIVLQALGVPSTLVFTLVGPHK